MKGIFKQALSVTLLLSVVTSSVFASAPVGTPAATTWKTSLSNAWTNVRNSNAWTKTSDSMSKAYDSAKDYVCVNGPDAVEYAEENKAKAAGIAAGALLATGATVYGLKKAYRYFSPAQSTALVVVGQPITSVDLNAAAIKAEHKAKRAVERSSYENALKECDSLEQAVTPGYSVFGIRFLANAPQVNAPVEARSEEVSLDSSPVVSSEDVSGRAYFNFVGKAYDRLTRKSALAVEKEVVPVVEASASSSALRKPTHAAVAKPRSLPKFKNPVNSVMPAALEPISEEKSSDVSSVVSSSVAPSVYSNVIGSEPAAEQGAAIQSARNAAIAAQVARDAAIEAERVSRIVAQMAADEVMARELQAAMEAEGNAVRIAREAAIAAEHAAQVAAEQAQMAADEAMARELSALINAAPVVRPAVAVQASASSSVAPVRVQAPVVRPAVAVQAPASSSVAPRALTNEERRQANIARNRAAILNKRK